MCPSRIGYRLIANEPLLHSVEVGFRQNLLIWVLGVVALTIFLMVAALVFKIWEREWTFLDAFYFSFVTMTTVGFGDMVPSERENGSDKFCIPPNLSESLMHDTCLEYSSFWKRAPDR